MARMFPSPIASEVPSKAEQVLYSLFQNQLPDDYHVFHSVAWQARDELRGAQDGEADFVVTHPQHGILVLEVKGGLIDYDGQNGVWLQNGFLMRKDPFDQAKVFKYYLLNLLKAEPYWTNRHFLISHAVAFPDVIVPNSPLTLQSPRRIILDKRDTLAVREWVEAHFAYAHGERAWDRPGQEGMRYLINLLAPVRHLRPLLGVDIVAEEAEFVRLTEHQCRLIDFITTVPRAAIAGCAGSGKTMLAAYKASQLAGEGLRVLFTCFNKNLASFLSQDYLSARPVTLDILHFHKLASDLVKQSGQKVGQHLGENLDDYLTYRLPEQLATTIDQIGPQYDAIIVDEAQDFLESWWIPLQMLLKKPDEGILYLFYDDNQNIYGGLQRVKNIVQSEYPLRENCRNTQKISQLVNRYYKGSQSLVALGPFGREVTVLSYDDQHSLFQNLRRTLHELVVEQEVPVEDIVVLTPYSESRSQLSRAGSLGRFRLTTNWESGTNEIYYTTIHSFKGLESPIIILAEIESTLQHRVQELLYVACSRARNHLVVICHEEVKGWLLS